MTPLCTVRGCPEPKNPDWHVPWCLEIPGVEHRADQATHQHVPKKGMGGKNKASKIRACLCQPCHMRVDNGFDWGNGVMPDKDGNLCYALWDRTDKNIEHPLIWRVVEAGNAAEEAGGLDNPLEPQPATRPASGGDSSPAASSASVEGAGPDRPGELPARGSPLEANIDSPMSELLVDSTAAAPLSQKGDDDGYQASSDGGERVCREGAAAQRSEGSAGKDEQSTADGQARLQVVDRAGGRSPRAANGSDERGLQVTQWGTFTATGWTPPPSLDNGAIEEIVAAISRQVRLRQFGHGDFALWLERTKGEDAAQWLPDMGYDHRTLGNMMRVCEAIPLDQRREELTWSMHVLFYHYDSETRESYLDRAVEERWSMDAAREQLREDGHLRAPEPKLYICPECGHRAERSEFKKGD